MKPARALAAMLAAGGAALLLAWWWPSAPPEPEAPPARAAALPAPIKLPGAPASAASSASPGAPLSPLGLAQRREQLALAQARLARAQQALAAYQAAAQYPHESRPMEEHPDQVRPFAPIAEDRALRVPGGTAPQGVRLKTTQERVFASGNESSRITVTLQDQEGRTLPLAVRQATIKEVTPPGKTASTAAFNATPVLTDGTYSWVMQPALQGFASFAGTVRLELHLDYGGQPGFLYFDLVYSPGSAATWLPGVREAATPASLDFFLKAKVNQPGRYVLSARVDDAAGKPVALALFNAEVGTGTVEFRLPVFGKLIRDKQPTFPLSLRDVEGFLLKPDAFPDRVMLARLPGVVHTSKSYPLAFFSAAEWQSEERTRYLEELSKDVTEASRKVQDLQGP
jgi:hypothetical protein